MKRVKVSTREIVIIVIMLAAVLYGVYGFFIASSPKSIKTVTLENAGEIDNLITDASAVLKDNGSYPVYACIVTSAENNWERDPFYKESASLVNVMGLGVEYTGYLEIGNRRMAIINNVSYEIGDELELVEYVVRHIRPSAVVIEGKTKGMSVTIPLLEE
ncbi:MAG: hypothetical protein U9N37_07585 [Thermodesulfobacteriota bacterium]|nr:hypothetical protein [Thermodesulfobacteriota bacterium]